MMADEVRYLPSADIPGISDTVRAAGFIFVSGQTPGAARGASFADQVDAAFAALDAALQRAGTDLTRLVRITIYVTDLPGRDLSLIREIRDRWVDVAKPPASSLVGIAALAFPDIAVEVEAIALA